MASTRSRSRPSDTESAATTTPAPAREKPVVKAAPTATVRAGRVQKRRTPAKAASTVVPAPSLRGRPPRTVDENQRELWAFLSGEFPQPAGHALDEMWVVFPTREQFRECGRFGLYERLTRMMKREGKSLVHLAASLGLPMQLSGNPRPRRRPHVVRAVTSAPAPTPAISAAAPMSAEPIPAPTSHDPSPRLAPASLTRRQRQDQTLHEQCQVWMQRLVGLASEHGWTLGFGADYAGSPTGRFVVLPAIQSRIGYFRALADLAPRLHDPSKRCCSTGKSRRRIGEMTEQDSPYAKEALVWWWARRHLGDTEETQGVRNMMHRRMTACVEDNKKLWGAAPPGHPLQVLLSQTARPIPKKTRAAV
jgi:hypothetical protein